MRIRWFRAVASVTLACAMLVSNAGFLVPPTAAQVPGFGPQMGMGGGFGTPGFGSEFGYGGTPAPMYQPAPFQQAPQASQQQPGDRLRLTPTVPGTCTSQTYQTLALPRGSEVSIPRTPEVSTVAAKSNTTNNDTEKADPRRSNERPDLEGLSPIEAAFQLVDSEQLPVQVIFETPRTVSPPPAPYIPVAATATMPGFRAAEDAETAVKQGMQQQAFRTAQVTTAPAPVVRFLGPFGAPLRQYGYAVFSSYVSTFAPIDDVPVGPDYVVGPGDALTVSMWGPLESSVSRTVDRSGQIMLPRVGDLRVWGLTFAQADRLIREQLGRYFRGFQTSVTMGRLRTLRVQVIGEVCQPGSYIVNSLSTLTHALYSAGGPSKLGSLRQVRLLRNGHVVGEIDLYDFLLRGDRTRDYRLEAGDTIFVPTIGDVAAIAGEVKRPAIYELRSDARLSDVMEAAGGVTPTGYLKRVQIVRAQASAERRTLDVDLSNFYLKGDMEANPPVHGGDLVLVHKNDSRIYNAVKVEGAVKYPGVYELKPMMRLSQLVPADRLLPEAYPDRIEIARRRPDYTVEVITANLKKAWTGDLDHDPLLAANDEVTIRTGMRATRTITLAGQVARPGSYIIADGERLSSVLERAGGFTARANLKGAVFTRASLRKVEQEQLNSFIRVQEQRILAEATTTVIGGDKEDVAIGTAVVQARRDFLRALASRVAVGRMVIKVAPPEQLRNTNEDIVLTDGDSLEVPEPVESVLVLGSVRTSTSVHYMPGAGVDAYVNRVGGYAKEADKKEIHIVKADGSAVAGFANIRTVDPGDTIIVPRSEDSKLRLLPTIRDGFSILGSTFSTVLSLAALAVLF